MPRLFHYLPEEDRIAITPENMEAIGKRFPGTTRFLVKLGSPLMIIAACYGDDPKAVEQAFKEEHPEIDLSECMLMYGPKSLKQIDAFYRDMGPDGKQSRGA